MSRDAFSEMNSGRVIEDLQQKLRAVLDPLMRGQRYALLDFPDHPNVGDSAIWLGESAYFRARGDKPCLITRTEVPGADELSAADTIFLHGGGNFGDLWPAHQHLRIEVMKRAKGTPIVQLPQSIHFGTEALIPETSRAIHQHGDVTLMVRDQPSFDFASKHFGCKIVLAPDMAFCMGAQQPHPADVNRFCLLRTDHETTGKFSAADVPAGAVVEDWLSEPVADVRRARLWGLVTHALSAPAAKRLAVFDAAAAHRVRRGSRALSRGRVVITDRLHGHILCCLLGIPHVALDNSYRKIGNFIDSWTYKADFVRTATTLEEATRLADMLHEQFGGGRA